MHRRLDQQDATGTWNRYGFHLGTNFFDYPHLRVWPDAYYMSMNVFNSAGTAFLGPQPFAFDRTAMLAGTAATFVTHRPHWRPTDDAISARRPRRLDPAAGRRAQPFVECPGTARHSASTTSTSTSAPRPTRPSRSSPRSVRAAFTAALPDHPRLRAASRNGDRAGRHRRPARCSGWRTAASPTATNRWSATTPSAPGGVARHALVRAARRRPTGPVTVVQESTYQPDTTWRWMGSAAMDLQGNLALGFSASSSRDLPADPLCRAAGDRPAEHPGPGRGDPVRRHRLARPAPATAGATTAT